MPRVFERSSGGRSDSGFERRTKKIVEFVKMWRIRCGRSPRHYALHDMCVRRCYIVVSRSTLIDTDRPRCLLVCLGRIDRVRCVLNRFLHQISAHRKGNFMYHGTCPSPLGTLYYPMGFATWTSNHVSPSAVAALPLSTTTPLATSTPHDAPPTASPLVDASRFWTTSERIGNSQFPFVGVDWRECSILFFRNASQYK